MAKAICENCKNWKSPMEKEMYVRGQCRIAAPKTYQTGGDGYEIGHVTAWPMTYDRDFCGEFKERSDA